MAQILVVVGTRPEIVKMAPVVRALQEKDVNFTFVHTGQHYEADHISDLLFAPTDIAKKNLENEQVHGAIYVTGNTVMDAVTQHMPLAEKKSNVMDEIRYDEFILATTHRAENVDNPDVLADFIEVFMEAPFPVVFPAHPRTLNRLKEFNLYEKLSVSRNVHLLPPLGYFDFLVLMRNP